MSTKSAESVSAEEELLLLGSKIVLRSLAFLAYCSLRDAFPFRGESDVENDFQCSWTLKSHAARNGLPPPTASVRRHRLFLNGP